MNKAIAIYFSDPEPMAYPFSKEQYLVSYQQIISDVEKQGVDVFIVRADSYLGEGKFKQGWRLVGDQVQEVEGEIRVDLIFNRDDKNTIPEIHDCKIINQPEFDDLCVDKVKTFETFPGLSPKTASIHSYKEYCQKLEEWEMNPAEMIVLKKNFATEGRGIFIMPIEEIQESMYDDWSDVMIQEFLDSSIGIEGITDGLHDLRITVINGEPINSFLREPVEGSYLANVAQGGSGKSIDLKLIPAEVIDLVYQIDGKIKQWFPAVYAADFIHSDKGYKLLELNSRPGVQHPDWSETYQKFNDRLVTMLVEAVNS